MAAEIKFFLLTTFSMLMICAPVVIPLLLFVGGPASAMSVLIGPPALLFSMLTAINLSHRL